MRWLPIEPRVALLAALVLAVAYVPLSRTPFIQELEGQLLDLRFHLKPEAPPSDEVILVLIDDRSLREIGRWPWPREVIADLVGRIDAAGPSAIGLDLLFAEPERETVPDAWLDDLRQALRGLEDVAPAEREAIVDEVRRRLGTAPGDRALAGALHDAARVVLPFTVDFSGERDGEAPDFVAASAYRVVVGAGTDRDVPEAGGLLAPLPLIGEAASGLGHANIALDPGGAARFEYPVVAHGGDFYSSFAIEVARQHLGVSRARMTAELGRGVRLGERFVPTDERMRLVVDYYRPGHFETVPAAAVLDGEVPPGTLAGRVVLVGGAAAGIGGGFVSPFGLRLLGLERHATVIENVLRSDHLVRRDVHTLLHPGLLLIAGALLGAAAARAGVPGASAVFGGLATALVGANLLAFLRFDLWLELLLPLVSLGLVYIAVASYAYLVDIRQERRLRDAFEHYLHPDLVEQVAKSPALLKRGGEQRELTVLFADLRASTTFASFLPPALFVELLNDFFETATRAIFAERGMLDKFMGDGLLAVFGAPLALPDHAPRACRAALAVRDALPDLQGRWEGPGLPAIDFGVGINTGPMVIGNMGTSARFDYTVIGDEANLGARLEAANKEFGTRILISEATFRAVEGRFAAREIDVVKFRGIERPVRTFELLGEEPLPETERARISLFTTGLAAYRAGEWRAALERFERALAMDGDDGPARLFAARCRDRLGSRPPAG